MGCSRISQVFVVLLVMGLSACAGKVDSFAVERVIARGARVGDVPKACALGESLVHAIGAVGREDHPARKALVIAEVTAAFCQEDRAREAQLDGARALRNLATLGAARSAEVQDARIRE